MRTSRRLSRLGGGCFDQYCSEKALQGKREALMSMDSHPRRWMVVLTIFILGVMLMSTTGCTALRGSTPLRISP